MRKRPMGTTKLAVLVTIAFSVLGVVGDYFLKRASLKEHSLKAAELYISASSFMLRWRSGGCS
jgi:hypothetical protein